MFDERTDRVFGKFRGKVVDNADEQHQGLLKVRVPDVFGEKAEVMAEPCLPYGHFFVPPKGTDVWVEFEAGDPTRPVWVGVWYPPGTTPAEAEQSPPEHRVIKTAAGHTVEIVDTEGEERILIRHSGDAFLSIDKDGGVLLYNPKGSHLHLDAKNGAASLVEQHGNHVAMGEKGIALVNGDGTMVNITGDTVHVSAAKVVVDATTVALGAGASEPTLLANQFKTLWQVLLTHIHPTTAPGAPTLPSAELQALQLIPGVHLSSSVVVK
jgi:phage gp45-like